MPRIEIPLVDIPAGRPVRLECGDIGIVVVKTAEGVRAYEDSCPHAQWRLSDGDLVDDVLECPGHGWEFHASTGRCINVPAYCLKPCSVTVRGEMADIEIHARTEDQEQPTSYDGQAAL